MFRNKLHAASHMHESPNEVIGVGIVLFRGELGGVELSGSQDLQHSVQGLGYRHRAAFLSRIDDVYYLGKKENIRVSLDAACKHMHKHPPAGHAVLCVCVLKTCTYLRHMHNKIFTGAKLLKFLLWNTSKSQDLMLVV